jgi:hypothetical protein
MPRKRHKPEAIVTKLTNMAGVACLDGSTTRLQIGIEREALGVTLPTMPKFTQRTLAPLAWFPRMPTLAPGKLAMLPRDRRASLFLCARSLQPFLRRAGLRRLARGGQKSRSGSPGRRNSVEGRRVRY